MKKLEYFEVKIDVDLELDDIREIRMSLKPSVEKAIQSKDLKNL